MTPPSYVPDPRVDQYLDGLHEWQQAVCHEVRELVHAADPEVEETIKRIVPDPEGIITAGHDNKTARTVAVYEGGALNAPALGRMFEQIIANNRAGGWRKLKRGT
jgi:hypothetical protein